MELVDLAGNHLTDAVVPLLSEVLARTQVLYDLSLSANKLTADGLHQLLGTKARTSLRFLDVSHTRLDNCGFRFPHMFTAHAALERLNVAYTSLSDADFALLVAALPTALQELNARGAQFHSHPLLCGCVCVSHGQR